MRTLLLFVILLSAFLPRSAIADIRYWCAGTGLWSHADNWRDGGVNDPCGTGYSGVPQDGDDVTIVTENGPGLWIVEYDNSLNPDAEFQTISIGERDGGDIQLLLNHGYDLRTNSLYVGKGWGLYFGQGSVRHENGTAFATYLGVGYLDHYGAYRICGENAVIESGTLDIGSYIQCHFYHDLGEVNTDWLRLVNGAYQMTGGTLNVANDTDMCDYRTTTFLHSGGDFNATGELVLGEYCSAPDDSAKYFLSGSGELTVGGDFIIARYGDGTFLFDQSGGTAQVAGNLITGQFSSDAAPKLMLTGGTLAVSGNLSRANGDNLLRLDGGTLIVNGSTMEFGTLQAGFDTGTNGSLTIKDHHDVTADDVSLGHLGVGNITQEGGTVTCAGKLDLGYSGYGTWELQDGNLAVGGNAVIGKDNSGIGWVNQLGGDFVATKAVVLGANYNSQGSFTFSGDTFSAARLTIGNFGAGGYSQTGGTATIDSLELAAEPSGSGTCQIDRGTVNAGSVCVGGRLDGDGGDPSPGGEAAMSITNSGLVEIGGPLYILAGNHLDLGGGTLSLAEAPALHAAFGYLDFASGTLVLRDDTALDSVFLDEVFTALHEIVTDQHLKLTGTGEMQTTLKIAGGILSAAELTNTSNFVFSTGRFNKLGDPLNISPTGTFGATVTAALDQHYHAESDINIDSGTCALTGGVISALGVIDNTATGTITGHGTLTAEDGVVNSGTMLFSGGNTHIHGDLTTMSGSLIDVAGAATLRLHDSIAHAGTLTTRPGGRSVVVGNYTGDGIFTGGGTVRFNGLVDHGGGPEELACGGDVELGDNALLAFQIAGTLSSDCDRLSAGGQLSLGGTMEITLENGFVPEGGDSFDLLDWAIVDGIFQTVNLPTLGGSLGWDATALYTDGILAVYDELSPVDTLPTATALHDICPNPFNPTTTIRCDLAQASTVTMRIYDLSGRAMRSLLNTRLEPGRHSIAWNGRDDEGRTLAAGTYLVRLQTSNFAGSRTVTLVK